MLLTKLCSVSQLYVNKFCMHPVPCTQGLAKYGRVGAHAAYVRLPALSPVDVGIMLSMLTVDLHTCVPYQHWPGCGVLHGLIEMMLHSRNQHSCAATYETSWQLVLQHNDAEQHMLCYGISTDIITTPCPTECLLVSFRSRFLAV